MYGPIDTYVAGDSWLHRLDPRVKLWATVLGFVMVLWLPGLLWPALLLLGLHALLLLVGVPVRALRTLWAQMGLVVILILLVQPWAQPSGTLLLRVGPLRLTTGGLVQALHLALRAVGLAFVTGTLLFTTSQPALILALVRLGLPYTWGLTFTLTLRFLPAIYRLLHTIREAQAARGWVAEGHLFRRMREYLPVLIATIIGTLRMSDQLTLALAARGLGGGGARTRWRDLRMGWRDWGAFLLVTVAFLLFVLWRL